MRIPRFQKLILTTALFATIALLNAPSILSSGLQGIELTAEDGLMGDDFGISVALNGNTALVGAFGNDSLGSDAGSAYVFSQSGSAWVQSAHITAPDVAAGDNFGVSVALESNTAVIGAPGDDDSGSNSGAVYVYVRTGDTWTEQAKLIADDGDMGDEFGLSVSLHGNTLVVGAPGDEVAGESAGSAYVFVRQGNSWNQQSKIVASDATSGDAFGASVDIEGNSLVVGARFNTELGLNAGAVYVFVQNGGTWTQQTKLKADDGRGGDTFGTSVSLHGNRIAVGSRFNSQNGASSGAAYVFANQSNTWTQEAKLTGHDTVTGDSFGISVHLEGDTLVAGANANDESGNDSGAAYLFERLGSSWSQTAKLMASDAAQGDSFGGSIAISGDTLIVGARFGDGNETNSGSAYAFALNVNQPPTANAGQNLQVEWASEGVTASLDGGDSTDPDGDSLAYTWKGQFPENDGIITGVNPFVTFPQTGAYEITLTVDDGFGGTDTDTVTIEVADETAPVVSATLNPHRKVKKNKGKFQVAFSCSDTGDNAPHVALASLNGVVVDLGQIVKLKLDDDNKFKWHHGVLEMEAPSFELLVVCEDASGNTNIETASPTFKQDKKAHRRHHDRKGHGDDDDGDDDDDDDDDDD